MNAKRSVVLAAILLVAALIVSACVPQSPSTPPPTRDPLFDALATGQAQQAESLNAIQTQLAKPQPTASLPIIGLVTQTPVPTATSAPADQGPAQSSDQWEIEYFTGATALMRDFRFTDFVPGWVEFPNKDWPAGDFLAKNGLEYGQELSDFCQQDVKCDFPVAARSFRTITADYDISGLGSCKAENGIGCAAILVNMGDVNASFRDQMVDTGHTITGLYWNGDEVDQAISAWASHVVYRMVGVPGNNPANPGGNCSVPTGCKGVDITFGIYSGNELLARGHAIVRP